MTQNRYVMPANVANPFPAIAAGLTGSPQQITTTGGAKASNAHIIFATNLLANDTITIGSSVWTIKASGAVLASKEINVGGTLTLSLDAIVTALNLSTDATTALFTWSKTDTATGLTGAADANGTNANVALATNSVGATVTAPAAGRDNAVVSLLTETTVFNNATGGNATLAAGIDGQDHNLVNEGSGTFTVSGTFQGGTSASIPTTKSLVLCWLGSKWRVIANDGATVS